MCGICGYVTRRDLSETDRRRVLGMNMALAHRGPDGAGAFDGEGIGIAMRRLAIIDPAGGDQPLFNEDRTLVLVANGEIYNAPELRTCLEGEGHRFATGSDCEALLHLYERDRLDFVHSLRGMFAAAIWDINQSRLVLVRDRMGEKPLYIHETDKGLWFASELKALVGSGVVGFDLAPEALVDYFHYSYVPEPHTMIRNVRKLPAGHMLTIGRKEWRLREHKYWSMGKCPPIEGNPVRLIRERLEDAARLAIRSDMPVGIALSGGVDSSALAVLANRYSKGRIHGLTVGYRGAPKTDERVAARRLADGEGMPFLEVEVSAEDVVGMLPSLCWEQDDPIGDVSVSGYAAVAGLARTNNIPVLIQGQGGDELFWGYGFPETVAWQELRRLCRSGAGPQHADLGTRRSGMDRGLGHLRDRVKRLVHGWSDEVIRTEHGTKFPSLTAFFGLSNRMLPKILQRSVLEEAKAHDPLWALTIDPARTDFGVAITELMCGTYLLENGIAQGDRLAMRSSVELRLPLMDHLLVETIVGLRQCRHDCKLNAKMWFRAALRDLLPEWVLNKPKLGFVPPVHQWLSHIRASLGNYLEDGYLVGHRIVYPDAAGRLARSRLPGTPWNRKFYAAMALELWCRGMASQAGRFSPDTRIGK